jgi:hypothetical protein
MSSWEIQPYKNIVIKLLYLKMVLEQQPKVIFITLTHIITNFLTLKFTIAGTMAKYGF